MLLHRFALVPLYIKPDNYMRNYLLKTSIYLQRDKNIEFILYESKLNYNISNIPTTA